MEITVKIKVPDGDTCFFESGYSCSWILKHSSSKQRWCRAFNDERLPEYGKCPSCKSACQK